VNTTCIYLARAGRSRKKRKPRIRRNVKKKREVVCISSILLVFYRAEDVNIEHARSSFPANEELAGSNQDLTGRSIAV
jgi:hypothetical protein